MGKFAFTLVILLNTRILLCAQEPRQLRLTLPQCIEIATESSLQAFRSENLYMASHWEYLSYKAGRLPALSTQLTPINYNSNFIRRYDFDENVEVYRRQQSIYSSGGLSMSQNVGFTGGTVTIDSELDHMRYFGDNTYSQFSSVPVRIGYSQSLFGFNSFKWEKKTEPLKYEAARQQFLYNREVIAETATRLFFSLAMAQAEHQLAKENVNSTDSLYLAGKERARISVISQADLQTLRLDHINALNSLDNAAVNLQEATFAFVTYFNFDKDTEILLYLPVALGVRNIDDRAAVSQMKIHNPDILAYRRQILQSERDLDVAKKNASFGASLSASVGFNQAANEFTDVYSDPLRQDVVRIGISLPILDWGVRKGRVNMARNNLNVTRFSSEQGEREIEQEVIIAVRKFNSQQELIDRSNEALGLAVSAFNTNKQRFAVGMADISTVTLSLNRRMQAQRNYLSALAGYWIGYYNIRKLTLFDFEQNAPLSHRFDETILQ